MFLLFYSYLSTPTVQYTKITVISNFLWLAVYITSIVYDQYFTIWNVFKSNRNHHHMFMIFLFCFRAILVVWSWRIHGTQNVKFTVFILINLLALYIFTLNKFHRVRLVNEKDTAHKIFLTTKRVIISWLNKYIFTLS